jgi:glutamate/tyrosine decarboxylase-like PLP-dependent enzyme
VTSISADLHKFGYAAKGASLLVWRSIDAMRHQFFVATDFPGGIYASPTMLGTRPGGPVAAAWAALQSLGVDGYLDRTHGRCAADRLRTGIAQVPRLVLLGKGDATIVAFAAVNLVELRDRNRPGARWTSSPAPAGVAASRSPRITRRSSTRTCMTSRLR